MNKSVPSRAASWDALAAVPLFAFVGGRGNPVRGLNVDLRPSQEFYAELAGLPKDAMIAGWPLGVLDNIPYVARRQVLVDFESHQIYHVDYVLEMRRRTEALIAAYFATTTGPLEALRDKFRVTHLLIDLKHFDEETPRYFEPFDKSPIKRATAQGGLGYEVLRQAKHSIKMRDGQHILIDLERVHSSQHQEAG